MSVEAYLAMPPGSPDLRLNYGSDPQQIGHLYLPKGEGPFPALIVIHGGCWRAAYGLEPLGQLCETARSMGFVVWNIEYRRLRFGGGWPTTMLDVAAAADYLRTLAQDYPIDLGRVIVTGHSAGGHLALWLAGRRRLPSRSALFRPDPLPLAGVVALAAIPDLEEAVAQGICGDAAAELIGGSPEQYPERYAQASPRRLLHLGVLHHHIVGDRDPIVPADYVRRFVTLAVPRDEAMLDVLPDCGHFEVVNPVSSAWPTIARALVTAVGRA